MSLLTKILVAPLVLLVLLLALPLLVVLYVCRIICSVALAAVVAVLWLPRKMRYLIVYSDSVQWKAYFEQEIIPGFECTSRVINLSRDGGRKKWWHLDWILYWFCAGYRNRFPIIIRFSPVGTWREIRFYNAFVQAKRGDSSALDSAKAAVDQWLKENSQA